MFIFRDPGKIAAEQAAYKEACEKASETGGPWPDPPKQSDEEKAFERSIAFSDSAAARELHRKRGHGVSVPYGYADDPEDCCFAQDAGMPEPCATGSSPFKLGKK